MHTAASAELLPGNDSPAEIIAPSKLVVATGKAAVKESLLASREFTPDKTWLAKFRPDRTSDEFRYIPHTYENDALMHYDPKSSTVEVGYMSSALIVDMLQGQLDTEEVLRNEGKEPPDRRFSFIATDGTFYKANKIIKLAELRHTPTASKHVAVFEDFAVKIDDIYYLTLAPPEQQPQDTAT